MWKYESCGSRNISLHDNLIDKVSVLDDDIYLLFSDGFDVDASHPLNHTKRVKHTTESQMILKGAQFLKGTILDKEPVQAFDYSFFIENMVRFEVLELKHEAHEISFIGVLRTVHDHLVEISFVCSEAVFCWNAYCGDAWYQDWPPKKA